MKPYPQMPALTQEEFAAFLDEMPLARLSSLNPDGTIHTVAVYFKYEDGAILIGTQAMTHKVKNVEHNPNVTLLIDNQTPPWKGALIYGTATLDTEDVVAKRTAIFERYAHRGCPGTGVEPRRQLHPGEHPHYAPNRRERPNGLTAILAP